MPVGKHVWKTPTLVEYGTMLELTRARAGSHLDMGGGNGTDFLSDGCTDGGQDSSGHTDANDADPVCGL